jgi:hypothetical protein
MKVPVYTELSNFAIRKNGKKLHTEISIVMLLNRLSKPIEVINSIYNFAVESEHKIEVIIINIDKEGYNYEKLLKNFPVLRVLLPKESISIKDAIALALGETLSDNVMFINEHFKLKSLDMDLIKRYFQDPHFGAVIPVITDENKENVPNIVKASIDSGFISSITVDIKGTSIASLYPKYFCFIVNRSLFISRDIELSDYGNEDYCLLEIGYRIWKEGYFIIQAPSFKAQYMSIPKGDIRYSPLDNDYMRFNYENITDENIVRGRKRKIMKLAMKFIITFRFKKAAKLIGFIKPVKSKSELPVDDATVITTINKDYE